MENLFTRLQNQATFIQQLKEKVDRIAVKDVSSEELLERIRMLEASQGDAAAAKLDPFKQADIIARLEALEGKVQQQAERPPPPEIQDGDLLPAAVEGRLGQLEQRLSGVYNVGGKLLALEQIASSLGVPIPDLEYPAGGQPQPPVQAVPLVLPHGLQPGQASERGQALLNSLSNNQLGSPRSAGGAGAAMVGGVSDTLDQGLWPSLSGSGRLAGRPSSLGSAGGANPSRLGGNGMPIPPIGAGTGAAAASAQRIAQLGQDVAAMRADGDELREGLTLLKQQVEKLQAGIGGNPEAAASAAAAGETLARLQAAEEGLSGVQSQVAEMLKREVRAEAAVSFADFTMLRDQVDSTLEEVKGHAAAFTMLRERDLPALTARLEEVAEGVTKAGEPRDMDTLFHERINALESGMGDLRTQLQESMHSGGTGGVGYEELEALHEQIDSKAPLELVRMVQQQAAAMGQAVAGLADSLALKPDVGESLRAASTLSTNLGPAVSKFRCLTCDQPINPGRVVSNETRTAKGSFLPRLEAMPAKEHASPQGPGVAAAELRHKQEERIAGLSISNVTSTTRGFKASDVEEYASGGGGSGGGSLGGTAGRDGSPPGKAMERARQARVAVGGGQGKPGVPLKAPVFL